MTSETLTPEDNQPEISTEDEPKKKSALVESLTDRQKVAALLVAMGQESASKVLNYFTPHELLMLNGVAQTLPDLDTFDLEDLVEEFEEKFATGGSLSEAGSRFNNLLRSTLGNDVVDEWLSDKDDSIMLVNVWEAVEDRTAESLAASLSDEHPQFLAYLFSRFPATMVSQIILLLPKEKRKAVLKQTMTLADLTPESIRMAELILHQHLSKKRIKEFGSNYDYVASICNNMEKEDLDRVLKELSDLSEEDLANIRSRVFVFEDLTRLSKQACVILCDTIETETFINALQGVDDEIKDRILESVSPRSKRMLENELAVPDRYVDPADVAEARKYIAKQAIHLASIGKISLTAVDKTTE